MKDVLSRAAGAAFLASVAFIAGCAQVPMADTSADAQAKTFAAPAKGKAGVYIYRKETLASALKMGILVDNVEIGETTTKTYVYVEVDPGVHSIKGRFENESEVRLQAQAGKLYFIWQDVKVDSLSSVRNALTLVDEQTGRAGVAETRRIGGGK